MQYTESLTELARSILRDAQEIDDFITSHGHSPPSFSIDGPTTFPASLDATRHHLIDATKQLRDLVIGPKDTIKWMIMNDHTLAASLHAISHFKVPQAVPLHGSISFSALAAAVGLPEVDVGRFVRRTAINHIFVESSPGYVSHTAASALIATDPQMQALVAHMSEEAFPASAKVVEALEKCPGSGEPGDSPFTLAFGSSFFERKAAQPETLQRFGLAMSSWSEGDGTQQMRNGYDWGSLPAGAKIVDVGGAAGHISLAIAENFPGLEFVIEDQSPLAGQAEKLIASAPKSVAERVKFLPHDFFQPQPVTTQGADLYIMRYILHDWSDYYAKKILHQIFGAMKKDSKLIIADAVMPPAGFLPRCQEEVLRSFDISMLAQLNSQERTLSMWEQLINEAGGGIWKILNITNPPKGESVTILEIGAA
ncbi:S-adenosyl-L-methionine-dependent methyltransferase [Aspergillus arachidicola]|uniref:S-adenosyl-L-methionine-dependent methyltransferase n=1 Tax=Aspergillus arachidicola TaxID=656916 RepID=A0A5N6YPS7_9EURO|nr:S-adenosyl-L-methionine-dependent methyltransferase [Aspergillus arachidicola]